MERREWQRWGGRAGWIVFGLALPALLIGICVASIPDADDPHGPGYGPLPSESTSP